MIAALDRTGARLGWIKPATSRVPRATSPRCSRSSRLSRRRASPTGPSTATLFFSVRDFPGYGKLSRANLDELRAGERVASDDAAKRDPLDFVVESAKPGEPSWPSGSARGARLAHRMLGDVVQGARIPFDLHGVCWDLQFPHHKNELAQSEGAFGARS